MNWCVKVRNRFPSSCKLSDILVFFFSACFSRSFCFEWCGHRKKCLDPNYTPVCGMSVRHVMLCRFQAKKNVFFVQFNQFHSVLFSITVIYNLYIFCHIYPMKTPLPIMKYSVIEHEKSNKKRNYIRFFRGIEMNVDFSLGGGGRGEKDLSLFYTRKPTNIIDWNRRKMIKPVLYSWCIWNEVSCEFIHYFIITS